MQAKELPSLISLYKNDNLIKITKLSNQNKKLIN